MRQAGTGGRRSRLVAVGRSATAGHTKNSRCVAGSSVVGRESSQPITVFRASSAAGPAPGRAEAAECNLEATPKQPEAIPQR